jgi:hypothetical protein
MADIMKDNVEIYIKELVSKELESNSNEEKVLWDSRKQMEMIWATKEREIKADENNRKLTRAL